MKLLLIFTILLLSITTFCQKTELVLNLYGGPSFYRGSGTVDATKMIAGIDFPGAYISNVYGKKPLLGFSAEAQLTRISKSNFMYGVGLSYDRLKGKALIDTLMYTCEVILAGQEYTYVADGKSVLTNNYFNINPFAGKRFLVKKISLDVTAGTDVGFCLSSTIKANATATIFSNKVQPTSNLSNPHPSIDIRPRIQLKASCKRTGIIAAYSLGITNYQTTAHGKAFTNFFHQAQDFFPSHLAQDALRGWNEAWLCA